MSLCRVLSIIMATIPVKNSTMTKEFMMLRTERNYNLSFSYLSSLVYMIVVKMSMWQKFNKMQLTHKEG